MLRYCTPSWLLGCWELLLTWLGLAGSCYLAMRQPAWSWSGFACYPLMGLCFVRAFVLFHDCAHGAFWPSRWANTVTAHLMGVVTCATPLHWSESHNYHHSIMGNSDLVDTGQTILFTKRQYESMPPWQRRVARVVRDPMVFFSIIPVFKWFIFDPLENIYNRGFTFSNAEAIVSIAFHLWFSTLFPHPCLYWSGAGFGASCGYLLFHLQHACNPGYRAPPKTWTKEAGALQGSTMLHLPKILEFFTLNIQ